MAPRKVAVIGGGMAGIGAAYTLAQNGWSDVTLIERGAELGGLAGSIRHGSSVLPLAYHHILHHDRVLLHFLEEIGARDQVQWRKIKMLMHFNERLYDLSRPADFARFPMRWSDKVRFIYLMLRCFFKSDWEDWEHAGADELIDSWGSSGVRHALFEPLTQLKFHLPCSAVSAAWLGARLHYREGTLPLGYIPGKNWTEVLCSGLTRLLRECGVKIRTEVGVRRLHMTGNKVVGAELDHDERVPCDEVVCALPAEVYRVMAPADTTRELANIHYTAAISVICATKQEIRPDFYWLNLTSLDCTASGMFILDSLNPSIGAADERHVNFILHIPGRGHPSFRRPDEEVMAGCLEDFHRILGHPLALEWSHVTRIPMYSPVFVKGFRNIPIRSETYDNVYFAGNHRTHPTVASTGTALASGIEAANAIMSEAQ